MTTFFLQLKIAPSLTNQHFDLVEGGYATCWVLADDVQSAYVKAVFYVEKSDWIPLETITSPVEVVQKHFHDKDIESAQYAKAQHDGIAIHYEGWARDGQTEMDSIPFRPSSCFRLSDYLKKQKTLSEKGRCLHYDAGSNCSDTISQAHSIQRKNKSLDAIALHGNVYMFSAEIGGLKKSQGRLFIKKNCGIKKVSTFPGFCHHHDEELFMPIDRQILIPTDQQVTLYAYRSLCRELFVKENAYNLIESQLPMMKGTVRQVYYERQKGMAFGLKNLKRHKKYYDNALKNKTYHDVRYVLFLLGGKPCIAFSGLFFPDYDFLGRKLQNLGDHNSQLDLITFCTAPVEDGWGILFAWHKSSSNVCIEFMRSLATAGYNDGCLADLLLRLAISNCENLALAPKWWETLSEVQQSQMLDMATLWTDIFCAIKTTYLSEGKTGIATWEVNRIIDNMY